MRASPDTALVPDPPGELSLDRVEQILCAAIHAQKLRATAESLLALNSEVLDAASEALARSAIAACKSISAQSRQIQDETIQVLNTCGVSATPDNSDRDTSALQYHAFALRIERRQLDLALDILADLGFRCPARRSGGEWECRKRFLDKLDLIKVDAGSTRLVLHANRSPGAKRIPKRLQPTAAEFRLVRFPKSLWWLYFALLSARLAKRFRKNVSSDSDDWPFLGTPVSLIPPLLEFAEVNSSDTLVDIGCGDGRVLTEAARLKRCRCIGVERDPALAELARTRVQKLELAGRVSIIEGNFADQNFDQADVVFLFLPVRSLAGLIETLSRQLMPGSRIVVHEQEQPPPSLKPALSRPVFNASAITVAHLWRL
ncbi:MAG TPA: methyltransferase domain-containing protein [Rhodothermales bacterium]|nr:methyltransferase domain-containing protein [Rhodothermales bacterium]